MLVANNMQQFRWPAKSLDLNPIDHFLNLLKCKVRAQTLQLNLRELTRVIHQMYAAIPQQNTQWYILLMSTLYLAVDTTPVGMYKVLKQN